MALSRGRLTGYANPLPGPQLMMCTKLCPSRALLKTQRCSPAMTGRFLIRVRTAQGRRLTLDCSIFFHMRINLNRLSSPAEGTGESCAPHPGESEKNWLQL